MSAYLKVGDEVYVAQQDLFNNTLVGTRGVITKIDGHRATMRIKDSNTGWTIETPLTDLEKLRSPEDTTSP